MMASLKDVEGEPRLAVKADGTVPDWDAISKEKERVRLLYEPHGIRKRGTNFQKPKKLKHN